ncbi:MAG: hypothetical protein K2N78_05835, partial [Oscillospiraceae bacterium]|nr:hypothetical protein [Oscillospiraceae bacterium]
MPGPVFLWSQDPRRLSSNRRQGPYVENNKIALAIYCAEEYYFRGKSWEKRGKYDRIEGMEYIDLRKVGRDGLREIRRQVVRLK